MTEKEIVEALLHCAGDNNSCKSCALYDVNDEDCECSRTLKREAVDLINRQKAEIERLTELEQGCYVTGYKNIRDEAIKEFAERLKNAEALEVAIKAVEKQMQKKPYTDNENGIYEKEHCPTCHRSLFPNDHHCKCGQALDWNGANLWKTR